MTLDARLSWSRSGSCSCGCSYSDSSAEQATCRGGDRAFRLDMGRDVDRLAQKLLAQPMIEASLPVQSQRLPLDGRPGRADEARCPGSPELQSAVLERDGDLLSKRMKAEPSHQR